MRLNMLTLLSGHSAAVVGKLQNVTFCVDQARALPWAQHGVPVCDWHLCNSRHSHGDIQLAFCPTLLSSTHFISRRGTEAIHSRVGMKRLEYMLWSSPCSTNTPS